MSRLKKLAISIAIAIIAILGIATVSSAYYVGQRLTLTEAQYLYSNNIFCMEHGQAIKGQMDYTVISNVRIEGTKSTDQTGKTIDHWDNARFAYILSQDNGPVKWTGPVANAIWNFGYTWMKDVGQYHAGLYLGFAGTSTGDYESGYNQAANDYANEISNINNVKDNTNKNNIQVVPYEKDGKQYMRIGPFNWSFGGKLTQVNVYDQNSKPISGILYSSYYGSEERWFDVGSIESGRDFYVSVPMDAGVTKITKIDGNMQINVKGVNIWFLEATQGYLQNMLIREPYDANQNIGLSFDYNIDVLGNLKVIKVNQDNTEVKLQGVGFYIQNKQLGKYVKQDANGNISYVNTREEATEFVTDQNGEIYIENLIVGTYVAYETKNPNYGYEFIEDGKEVNVTVDKTTDFQIGNKQIYVKLSGFVWVDKVSGKVSYRNDLYATNEHPEIDDYQDNFDILLDGITVRLKDRTTGETVMETKTANGGAYQFVDVLIEKLQDYYVEFEYDGLTYTNVVPHLENEQNGSKSAENAEVRDRFNKDFSTIEGSSQSTGITLNENGTKVHDLNYNIDQNAHTATLINNGQYPITGNTDEGGYNIRDHFTYGMEEIKWINQGLYEREQPDLALMKDMQNVRVTVNGYEHTYEYAQRFVNQGEYGDGFNVGVKFGNKYGSMSYTRAIYKADYEYINENDASKELKVYATYRIALRNESSNLITRVNNVVDYYDRNYTITRIGTSLDQNGQVVNSLSYNVDTYNDDNYSKAIINTNLSIEPQKQVDVYVEFELNRETVLNLINDQDEKLENVAEINSYSVFDSNGKVYAGIDRDSNPGNATPGNKPTYEDDTDSSPDFRLEIADARQLTGKVFLDSTSGELMTGEIRQGSGAYEDGETGIEGVAVTLTENTGSGKVYNATTDSNGDFLITDFIPGDYTLTYTWGDETYTVQNYKGTVYNKDRYDANVANKEWYKTDVDTRWTDATDDYALREQIDNEIKHITNSTETTIDKMNSTTPTMGIGVEYDTTYTASSGDRYVYQIRNVDFGIVERARQQLALNKRVATVKVTLANGQVVIDAAVDEDGNITGSKDHLIYMGPSETSMPENGFVRVELDNELIQGATIEIGYEFKATNESELDYLSENFYKYGIVEGDVVKITPSAIIDYLDSDWAFDNELNSNWQIKTQDEIKDLVAEVVYNNEESTINEKTILYTESLKEQQLEPTQSATTNLQVSKILSTSDDLTFSNETEMVALDKTGGSDPDEVPGNYIPGQGHTESDDDTAETVIVTPSTGGNRAFLIPTIIGVTALIVLGVGVVLIRRKALGNK